MAANDALTNSADSWHPDPSESRWMADALRSCRLSVLCGEAGSGKTSLLTAGLLPLLRRRAEDTRVAAARHGAQVIMPFPERRSVSRASLAELVVFVDRWGATPLTTVHERIDKALRDAGVEPETARLPLPDRVQALGDRHGTRLLFILDDFDTLLNAPDASAEHDELVGALVQLLNRRLPANAVIAVRSLTEPTFEAFGDRLFSIEAEVLVLTSAPEQSPGPVPTPLRAVPRSESPPVAAPATSAPVRPDDNAAPMVTVLRPSPTRPAPPRAETKPLADIGPRSASAEPGRGRTLWWAAAGLALLAVSLRLVLGDRPAPPPAPAPVSGPTAAAPATAALEVAASASNAAPASPRLPAPVAAPVQPRVDLLVAADGDMPRLPTELATALAADSGVDLQVKPIASEAASWRATAGSPHLAVLRYDALQRAAALKNKPALSVVAPLYTEEIAFVVRADSPLRFIHQLRGRRIEAGAADSSRSLTAQAVYRGLFAQAMPKSPDAQPGASAALQALANRPATGRSPDAVMLVAAAPDSPWARLPAETRNRLRLLRLDADDPSSRRALQTYLPATWRDDATAATGTPTLASMAFLVVAGNPSAEQADTLARLTQTMCSSLPGLQRSGAAKWREVRAGQQLDSGWPAAGAAAAAWSRCASPPAAEPPTRPSTTPSPTPQKGATS